MKKNVEKLIIVALISLLILSCSLPGMTDQKTEETSIAETVAVQLTASYDVQRLTEQAAAPAQETTAPEAAATGEPTATDSPTEAPTQAPTTANTEVPCNRAQFVSDVTYPDDTEVETNASFVKTWRIKNNGSCTWTSGYKLIFANGDQMGAPGEVSFTSGTVAPGQTADMSVNLIAPASAGTYRGNFKLKSPEGQVFGIGVNANSSFYVQIKAVEPPSSPTLPSLMTVVPLPTLFLARFTPTYSKTIDCTGSLVDGYFLKFKIENTGGMAIESMRVDVEDMTFGIDYTNTSNSFGSASTCVSVADFVIEPGTSAYFSVKLNDASPGHNMTATFRGCSQDDMNGICVNETLTFISGAP